MFDQPEDAHLPPARPVISWPGGKGRMLKHLLPLIPAHTCYVEPFFGGGALFFAKPQSHHEVINDINNDLVSFMRNARLHLDALLDETDLVLNSRKEFEDYLEQAGLTEIQRAARWFLRNRLSFGGMGRTFAVTRTHSLTSRAQRIIAIRSLSRRLDRTTVENRDWAKIVDLYDFDEAFFFFDPPYLDGAGAAYEGWSELELTRFCQRIQKLKGAWLVTFQDCEQVRDLLPGYTTKAVVRANGIGNNGRVRSGRVYREVIISSARAAAGRQRKGMSA
ncbi:MAG TPA: DNA adenine methylase [Opitutaceae bacterium]|jgi:DNA adenine methylase